MARLVLYEPILDTLTLSATISNQKLDMLECSACGKDFGKGGLCEKCGRIFCEDHISCTICNVNLRPISLKKENVYNYPIVWVISGYHKIGLADFETPPKELVISLNLPHFPDNTNIILFSSKNSSRNFINSAKPHLKIQSYLETTPYSEKSRYTIIASPFDEKFKYVLLNISAITLEQFNFILDFLIKCFKYAELLKDTDLLILKKAISEIFFKYNNKIGLPFVSLDEFNKQGINLLIESVIKNYSEYSALNETINFSNLAVAVDFLKYKIDLHFEILYSEKQFTFLDVLTLINYYLYIVTLRQILNNYEAIRNEVLRGIDKHHIKYLKKIENKVDLCQILDIIIKKDNVELETLEKYSSWVSKILIEAINLLEPKYDISREIIQLCKISEIYVDQIKQGHDLFHPVLGSSKNYVKLLTKICKNENVNSQIRIIAGESAANILCELILISSDYISYLEFVDLSYYLSKIIEEKIPELNEKANILQFDKIFGYHDSIRHLLTLSSFAEQLNDEKTYNKSSKLAHKLAQKYDSVPNLISITWKKYIKTHDLELLKYIHRHFMLIDKNIYNYMEPYIMTIGYLSTAVIERKDRDKNLDIAKEWCDKIFDPEIGDSDRSMHSFLLYKDILNIFQYILKAQDEDMKSSLESSKKYILSVFYEATQKEPLKSIALKTQILIDFINENESSVRTNIKSFLKGSKSRYIEEFCDKIDFWIEQKKSRKGRLFTLLDHINFKRDLDPWEKVMMKYIEQDMSMDLQQNIINVDVIVYVEGKVDKAVLEEFSKKINPSGNLFFEDLEGYNNIIIAQKDAKMTHLQKIPIYCIFDGDIKENVKNRIKEDKIKDAFMKLSEYVYIFKKHSIESYLLIPRAIKTAFPDMTATEKDIENFLKEGKNRKNKKIILDELFKKFGAGKYNQEKALAIAKEIRIEEIDSELFKLLSSLH